MRRSVRAGSGSSRIGRVRYAGVASRTYEERRGPVEF